MEYIKTICQANGIDCLDIQPLSGGDINDTYKINTAENAYVIKLNQASRFPKMFEIEAKSLDVLRKTKSFIIPKVIGFGNYEQHTYLILDHIKSVSGQDFSENFAIALAKLHQHQSENFGLDFDNYIGRLKQINLPRSQNAVDFYINLRLEPQFKMAKEKGFEFKNLGQFYKNLESIIPQEKSSLIHGDLWAGNYLISKDARPCIFDPAIAYAPREMDLAMMKLFGGYPQEVFKIYDELFPLPKDWELRIGLWQLYYILVHLNLFGASYLGQARQILKQFGA